MKRSRILQPVYRQQNRRRKNSSGSHVGGTGMELITNPALVCRNISSLLHLNCVSFNVGIFVSVPHLSIFDQQLKPHVVMHAFLKSFPRWNNIIYMFHSYLVLSCFSFTPLFLTNEVFCVHYA